MFESTQQQLQRTLSWYRARLGKITGSSVGKIIPAGKSKGAPFTGTGITYLTQVASELTLSPDIINDDELFAVNIH